MRDRSSPGVGSQGMSSGAAGERKPANVSPSPPGNPVSLTLKKSDCAGNTGSVSRPDEACELRPVREHRRLDADDVGVEHLPV